MLKTIDFIEKLEKFAPLSLSKKMIEKGAYDNSGLLVNSSNEVTGALFTLDLTESAVKKAKVLGVNTIVTHHPAIYAPLSTVSAFDTVSSAVHLAIGYGINVISMHLNLDICEGGIDACLCQALGGTEYKIINYITEKEGYGREFKLGVTFGEFAKTVKQTFGSKRVLTYGNKNAKLNCGASFCGAGGHDAIAYVKSKGKANVIITSDLAHHEIKEILDNGKALVILPHYTAEEYGFNKFYGWVKANVGNLPTYYMADKRFK